jgi:hypothetical protein
VRDAPSVMAIEGEAVGSSSNVREAVSFGAGYGGAGADLLSRG